MIIVIATTLVVFLSWNLYKFFFIGAVTSNDIDDFISGRFLDFPGGDMIDDLIPLYEELHEAIFFGYLDGRRTSIFTRSRFISFALRVQYSEDEFRERKRQAGETRPYNWHTESIDGYRFIEEGSFQHVAYGVLFNERESTITYMVVIGDDGDRITDGGSIFGLFSWNRPPGIW